LERLRRFRWPLTVVLILAAFAGAWRLWRPAAEPPPAPRPILVYTPTPAPTPLPPPTPTPAPVVVYVSGAVAHPGVYTLPAGARVADALQAAGGATAEADLAQLNLARRVRDEEQIHVPRPGETPPPASNAPPAASTPSGAAAGKVNINSAGLAELDSLPGIGPGYAQRIIDYRTSHGPFRSVEEIQNVPGIGPSTFARIREFITVE